MAPFLIAGVLITALSAWGFANPPTYGGAGSQPALVKNTDGPWRVDYERSRLGFIGSQSGITFDGVFDDFSADITFDPVNLGDAQVNVIINTASANTQDQLRDSKLTGSRMVCGK